MEFLTARLGEDQVAAKAATPGPWKTDDPLMSDHVGSVVLKDYVAGCSVRSGYRENSIQDAAHIARHDPARVLREVEAKRHVLKRHKVTAAKRDYPDLNACEGCGSKGYGYGYRTPDINDCPELRNMTSAYADHPDYNPAWRVE